MHTSEYNNIFSQENTHYYYKGIHHTILSQVKKFLDVKNGMILDAGCGTGLLAKKLEKYGEVYAVDISPVAIKLAKERKIRVKKASITKLPFKDKTFDLVVSIDVIYHLKVNDDKDALSEFNRVLKPGGILILKAPAYNWLQGNHDKLVHTRKRYTIKDLSQTLNQTNFLIIKSSYICSFLLIPAIVKRLYEKYFSKYYRSDIATPNKYINYILLKLFYIETAILNITSLPFGLSVFIIARKRTKVADK